MYSTDPTSAATILHPSVSPHNQILRSCDHQPVALRSMDDGDDPPVASALEVPLATRGWQGPGYVDADVAPRKPQTKAQNSAVPRTITSLPLHGLFPMAEAGLTIANENLMPAGNGDHRSASGRADIRAQAGFSPFMSQPSTRPSILDSFAARTLLELSQAPAGFPPGARHSLPAPPRPAGGLSNAAHTAQQQQERRPDLLHPPIGQDPDQLPQLPRHHGWRRYPHRMVKCDFCHQRLPGLIQACLDCCLTICRNCAVAGRLRPDDPRHPMDAASITWDDSAYLRWQRRSRRRRVTTRRPVTSSSDPDGTNLGPGGAEHTN